MNAERCFCRDPAICRQKCERAPAYRPPAEVKVGVPSGMTEDVVRFVESLGGKVTQTPAR